jgi:hypothetical protein
MTTGIIALAVPLSTTFAGEFLILAGVFQQGWGWAVVGAIAIVLAAMYALRLISGVLHQDVGPAVRGPDLRGTELGVVVPLVGLLLVLSAWPAAITDRAFAANKPRQTVVTDLAGAGKSAATTTTDFIEPYFANAPLIGVRADDCRAALNDPNVVARLPKDSTITCTDASGAYTRNPLGVGGLTIVGTAGQR